MNSIGIIGAGNMGSSLVRGLAANSDYALVICDSDPNKVEALVSHHPHARAGTITEAAMQDCLILAVKPQSADGVLSMLPHPLPGFVISIMTGISTARLQTSFGNDVPIVRAMPNLAASIQASITALYADPQIAPAVLAQATAVLRCIGETICLEQEEMMHAFTALAGSGPAYFFWLQELLIAAGISLGLPAPLAADLVKQTAYGASALAKISPDDVMRLRQQVTAPNGTTAAALSILQASDSAQLWERALHAAHQRSIELSES